MGSHKETKITGQDNMGQHFYMGPFKSNEDPSQVINYKPTTHFKFHPLVLFRSQQNITFTILDLH